MSSRWIDFLLDDNAEKQVGAPANENNSQILGFLHRAKQLEGAKGNDSHRADIKKEYVSLGKPNGERITRILMGLSGDALIDAVVGAGVIGRALEGHDGITSFSLSILIAYLAQFVGPKVIRSVLVLCRLLFFPNWAKKLESFAKRVGCSKNRVKKALAEVKENGLATPGKEGNAPGSGRPSFKTTFGAVMTAYLMAVTGLDEEALDKECSRRHIEAIQYTSDPDDTEAVTDIPTAASIKAAFAELKGIAAEVYARTDKAVETANLDHAVTLGMMKENLSSAMAKLEKEVEEIAAMEDISKERDAHNLTPEELATFNKACLKAQILPRMLSPIISLITERSNGILEAFKETEGKNSYHLVKEAKRNAKPKSLKARLVLLWDEYLLMLQDIETVENERPSADTSSQKSERAEQEATADIKMANVQSLLMTVLENLDCVKAKLESSGNEKTAKVKKALERLGKLKEMLCTDIQTFLSPEDQEAWYILTPMFCYLNIFCERWQYGWTDNSKNSQWASKTADAIQSESFRQGLAMFFDQLNFFVEQKEEPVIAPHQETDDSAKGSTDPQETNDDSDTLRMGLEEARKAVLQTMDIIRPLIQDLDDSYTAKRNRKNSKEGSIPEALMFLRTISERLQKEVDRLNEQENAWAGQTLLGMTLWLSDFLEGRLIKWKKDDAGKRIINYSQADRIAGSLCTKGSIAHLDEAWKRLDGIYDGTINPKTEGRYVSIEETGAIAEWFAQGTSLSPKGRYDCVQKLWNQGKDPRKVETWIDYIISEEYDRNYGDPSDRMKCCRITRSELQTAFQCLTGMACSDETLWTILTKDMGYTGRQCAKLDQVGEESKHRDEQFRYIQKRNEKADPKRTLAIYVDTKAFLLLGRLKHDNGKIMCRKDGRVYRVYDHDFALKLRQIYPHGTHLVDPSRLDESAILHPVGAYCPQDGTGYVALVLGKDTAESVCNLIRAVIDIKRKTMPELDTVLIMADGGGSNMANGVIWQSELLKVADDKNVTLEVHHYSPGSSKHNLIEHRMFSELSRNWKGRPLIDIEHVLSYVNSTRNKSLTVQGWFDTRRYETNAEKKARGEKIMTREQLNKEAGDRITHEYPDGEMYKWNYTVRPSSAQKATV